jgi:heme/copper-type cytochrome/quinol oxidase subunit 2
VVSSKFYLIIAFLLALSPVYIVIPIWIYNDVVVVENAGHGGGSDEMSTESMIMMQRDYVEANKLADGSVLAVTEENGNNLLKAQQFSWSPSVLRLEKGQDYTITVFSADVMHALTLVMGDSSYNVVLVPGSPASFEITPTEIGEFLILCSEYCGAGHDVMSASFIVQ